MTMTLCNYTFGILGGSCGEAQLKDIVTMETLAGQPDVCVFTVFLGADPGRRIPLYIAPRDGKGPTFFLELPSYYKLIGASYRKRAQELARTTRRVEFAKELAKFPSESSSFEDVKKHRAVWISPLAEE